MSEPWTVQIAHAPGRTLRVYDNNLVVPRDEAPGPGPGYGGEMLLLTMTLMGWMPVFALLAWAARDDR